MSRNSDQNLVSSHAWHCAISYLFAFFLCAAFEVSDLICSEFANVTMAASPILLLGFYSDYYDSFSVSALIVSHELTKMNSQAGMSPYARRTAH